MTKKKILAARKQTRKPSTRTYRDANKNTKKGGGGGGRPKPVKAKK
jgi:hypothetical protein